jgi:hypothetical protein
MRFASARWSLVTGAGLLLAGGPLPAVAQSGFPGHAVGYAYGMGPGMMAQGYGPGPAPCWCGPQHYAPGPGHGALPGMMMQQGAWQEANLGEPRDRPPYRQRFAAVDTNQDGVVAAGEAAKRAADIFAALDIDEDQAVTMEEYVAFDTGVPLLNDRPNAQERRRARRETRFQQLDQNDDGSLGRDEYITRQKQQFAGSDTDGDGKIDPFEFHAVRLGF